MSPLRLALGSVRRAFSEPRLLLALWLANLIPSLVALAPFVGPARDAFDRSPLGREAAFLDPEVLRVFQLRLSRGPDPAASLLLAAALMALLAPALAGGTLARLSESGRFAPGRFLEAAGRHYWKNVRLLLWAALAAIPLALPLAAAGGALRKAAERALFQGPLDRWRWALLGAAALAFLAWRAAFDLARALAVSRDERRTRRTAWAALRLLGRRPALLLGYGLVALAGLVAAWGAARVHAAVPVSGLGGVAAAFAVAQLFVLVRVGFSTAGYAFALGASEAVPGAAATATPTATAPPTPASPQAAPPTDFAHERVAACAGREGEGRRTPGPAPRTPGRACG